MIHRDIVHRCLLDFASEKDLNDMVGRFVDATNTMVLTSKNLSDASPLWSRPTRSSVQLSPMPSFHLKENIAVSNNQFRLFDTVMFSLSWKDGVGDSYT
jgi:hypothetical protein